MQSIHSDEEYEEEYKEQFRNMTGEKIEQHIGLEKVRHSVEGFDETYGIDKIKNLVEKIKEEREEADRKEFWNVTMSYVMENGFTKDDKIDKLNSRDGV